MPKHINQYITLLSRNFRIQFADRFGLMLTLLLPPVIAVLLIVAFWLIGNDTRENNNQMLVTQIMFDTIDICRKKIPTHSGRPGANAASCPNTQHYWCGCPLSKELASYKADNAKQALEDFKDDFYLFICLGDGVSDRYRKINNRELCNAAAENIWSQPLANELAEYSSGNNMDFLYNFSIFRYNMPETCAGIDNGEIKWLYDVDGTVKDKLKERAAVISELRERITGEEATRSNITVFFILIASAIWMGLLPACKEIVSEWDVFLWESRGKISGFSFLMSKFTVLAIITALQNIILVLIVCRLWQSMPWAYCIALYTVLFLTSACATSAGLLISSITTTLRAGLMIIPMVMVAQLILGGLLRLPAQTRDDSMKPIRMFACKSTIQYWAFEAVTGCVARLHHTVENNSENAILLNREVMTLKKPGDKVMSNRKNINSFLQSKFMRIDDYIFGEYIAEQNENNSSTSMRLLEKLNISDHICSTEDKASFKYHVVRPLCYIMLKTFVILILTWFWLKLRLQINYNGGFLPFLLKL